MKNQAFDSDIIFKFPENDSGGFLILLILIVFLAIVCGAILYAGGLGLWINLCVVVIFLFICFNIVRRALSARKTIIFNSDTVNVKYTYSSKYNWGSKLSDCVGFFSYRRSIADINLPATNFNTGHPKGIVLEFNDGKNINFECTIGSSQQNQLDKLISLLKNKGIKNCNPNGEDYYNLPLEQSKMIDVVNLAKTYIK